MPPFSAFGKRRGASCEDMDRVLATSLASSEAVMAIRSGRASGQPGLKRKKATYMARQEEDTVVRCPPPVVEHAVVRH